MTSTTFHPGPLHRLWRLLPAQERRRLASEVAAMLAPRIDPGLPPVRLGLAVAGEISRYSGLGEAARLFLRGLDHLHIANWAMDISGHLPAAAGGRAIGPCVEPPPGVPLLFHVNAPMLPLVMLRLPRRLPRGRRIVGYWLWELPNVPPEWRGGARFVHEVWVPSQFVAAAIEPLLPNRVHIVPFPLAIAAPEPLDLGRAAFGLPADAVIVLVSMNLASSLARKNPLGAIVAFRAAFGVRHDRLLVLKIANPDHHPADFALIAAAVGNAPNIRIDTQLYPPGVTHALTAAADIVLSLHRSEGFGLVPAEAMLLGKPVIATGWSGNMAFMDAQSAALVDFRLVEAKDPRRIYYGSDWAEPNLESAVFQLRRLADNATERAVLGLRAKRYALDRLGAAPLAAAVARLGLESDR
jgi:glycosyltransferase involved in cell wall biosynthesis